MLRTCRAPLLLILAALTSACDEGATAPPRVASIEIQAPSTSVAAGETLQLTARTLDVGGQALTGRTVEWSSSQPAVAEVSQAGQVTARTVGTTTITASSEGKTGQVTLTVTPAPVSRIEIRPASLEAQAGTTQQLSAHLFSTAGAELTGRTVTWSSSDTAIATVAGGTVQLKRAGSAVITAASKGQQARANVRVLPPPVASVTVLPSTVTVAPGQTTQLAATARDASGNPVPGVPVTWTVSPTGIARVDSTGLVTGVSDGTTTVMATAAGISGSASVRVETPAPSTGVRLTLTSPAPTRSFYVAVDQGPFGNTPRVLSIQTPQPTTRTTVAISLPAGSGFRIRGLVGDSTNARIAGASALVEGVNVTSGASQDIGLTLQPIRVENLTAPDTVAGGQNITVSWIVVDPGQTLENTGFLKVSGTVNYATSAFTDDTFASRESARGTEVSPGRYRFSVTFAAPLTPGTIYFQTQAGTIANVSTTGVSNYAFVTAPSTSRGEPLRTIVVR